MLFVSFLWPTIFVLITVISRVSSAFKDFIAHCLATFSALRALFMTNKDDDDDDDETT